MVRKSLICFFALSGLAGCVRTFDNTDNPTTGASSGLVVYVDNQTGCQYLRVGGFDGIFPRLGSDGRPMCGEGRA